MDDLDRPKTQLLIYTKEAQPQSVYTIQMSLMLIGVNVKVVMLTAVNVKVLTATGVSVKGRQQQLSVPVYMYWNTNET